jgi:hypothetical protein
MKNFTLFLFLLLGLSISNSLQAQIQYAIQNVGTGKYLTNSFDKSQITCQGADIKDAAAGVWQLEFVGGTTHVFRLKNSAKSDGYLYIEDGTNPQCGITDKKEKAAMFIFQIVDGVEGAIRLRSVAYLDLYLSCSSNGQVVTTKLDKAAQTSMWTVEELE